METKYKNSNTGRNLSYLLIGGGIGATLALLFAPKSGSELREDLSIAASNGLDKTRETVGKIRENAANYYEVAKEKSTNYLDSAKDTVNNLYNTVSDKAEDIADDVKALPHKTENFVANKVDQLNSAVAAGERELKKSTKTNGI